MHAMKASNAPSAPAETRAGAAVVDITPSGSVFLFGYPHVERMSVGVHDPLECAALYVEAGEGSAIFIANDLIFFTRDFAEEVRRRISVATRVPVEAIMLTATHTHSGPVMIDSLSNAADSVVPKADPSYLAWVAERMVEAASAAVAAAVPAELALTVARAKGVGCNRHDPAGPADPEVPVLLARTVAGRKPIGCMVVYAMHPTVLHEDSRWISADFPGYTRRWLRERVLGAACPVIYHLGAAGNQSPRHMTRANTFEEAERIGTNLARRIEAAIGGIASFRPVDTIRSRRVTLDLEPRNFPTVERAVEVLRQTRARFEKARADNASKQEVRTAECDVFGAEKTVLFAEAKADGRLAEAIRCASPAEIQVIRVGPWCFVGWPGEFFVEYGLALKTRAAEGTFLVTLANGELQGYIATPKAVEAGLYEATNAVFDAGNGERFVERTLELIARI